MGAKKKALSNVRRDEIVVEIVNLLVPEGDQSDRFSSEFVVLSTIQFIQQSTQKNRCGASLKQITNHSLRY
jgi:hypothetical protein